MTVDFLTNKDYSVYNHESLTFINLYGKYYLLVTVIENMGDSIKCPRCMVQPSTNTGTIAVGRGFIKGVIWCNTCGSIIICKFYKESIDLIKTTLKLEDDLINSQWEDIETANIH